MKSPRDLGDEIGNLIHDIFQNSSNLRRIACTVIEAAYNAMMALGVPTPNHFDEIPYLLRLIIHHKDEEAQDLFWDIRKSATDERSSKATVASLCAYSITHQLWHLFMFIENKKYSNYRSSIMLNFYVFNMTLSSLIHTNPIVLERDVDAFFDSMSRDPEGYAILKNVLVAASLKR